MRRLLLALVFVLGLSLAAWAGKINLNTATKEELVALPGVGPAIAERIVSYRLTGPIFGEHSTAHQALSSADERDGGEVQWPDQGDFGEHAVQGFEGASGGVEAVV